MKKRNVFPAWLLILCAGGAAAQTLDEVKIEAAGSWDLVACAAMYNIADRIVAEGGPSVTAVAGGSELLGVGAAMIRANTMGEDTDTAVGIAGEAVNRTTELMTEIYVADPAAFPAIVGWPAKMELCDRYAASVSEMMGVPTE